MQKGRIVVTGGAGFIGSAIVHELNMCGYEDIIIVDDLDNIWDRWKNISNLDFTELMDKEYFLRNELSNIGAIFHMGASSSTNIKMHDAIHNNYYYTMDTIARYARDAKIILASSGSVYGVYDGQARESSRMSPLNPYAFSKSLVDKWMPKMLNSHSNVVSLRFSNVFGPNEYHKGNMMSIVTKIIGDLRAERKVELFHDSHKMNRDFIYVEDVAKIAVKMMASNVWHKEPTKCGIFNVGSNSSVSFLDVATMTIEAVLGRPIEEGDIVYKPMPEGLKEKYQYHTLLGNSKIVSATNHNIKDVLTGIENYVATFYSRTIKKNIGEVTYDTSKTQKGH